MNQKNKKLLIVLSVVLVVLVAAAAILYMSFGPEAVAKRKAETTSPAGVSSTVPNTKATLSVTIKVVTDDGEKAFDYKTTGKTLEDVLTENKLAQGDTTEYGLYIKTVNGITADDTKQQWWCITKGGEQVNTGANATYLADGDTYELTLKTGYDEF